MAEENKTTAVATTSAPSAKPAPVKAETPREDPNEARIFYATDLFYFKGRWNRTGDDVTATLNEARFHLSAGRLSREKPKEKDKGPAEKAAEELAKAKAAEAKKAAS